MAQEGTRAETGLVAKRRDYTYEPLWSATPGRGTQKLLVRRWKQGL